MFTALVVCPSCSRHVRVDERACPFCVSPLPAALVPVPHGPTRRYVGKNATALAIIASALGAAGCAGSDTSTIAQPPDVATDSSDSAALDTSVHDSLAPFDGTASDVRDEGGPHPIYK